MIDHPFSLQSVCSSIEYTKLDNTIQRGGLYWNTMADEGGEGRGGEGGEGRDQRPDVHARVFEEPD